MRNSKIPLTTDVAVEILSVMGCSSDPITILSHKSNFALGEEVEVSELSEFQFLLSPYTAKSNAFEIPSSHMRIGFYGNRGYVEGTLLDLLIDRLNLYKGLKIKHSKRLKVAE